MNLFGLIRQSISSPEKVFLEDGGGRRITYGDMLSRTAQIANVLVARGVKPGDRVAVQVEKSVEICCFILRLCVQARFICR
jgi:malonyl-CoA/methylmalonyl-CoA synthetase